MTHRSLSCWRASIGGLAVAMSLVTAAAAADAPIGVADPVAADRSGASDGSVAAPSLPRQRAADELRPVLTTAQPSLDLSPHALRKAIADSRDPLDDVRSSGAAFGAGHSATRIDRAFRDAEIPSCVNGDALRFEPTTIGPIALGGLFVLPMWMHAIVTGRCKG